MKHSKKVLEALPEGTWSIARGYTPLVLLNPAWILERSTLGTNLDTPLVPNLNPTRTPLVAMVFSTNRNVISPPQKMSSRPTWRDPRFLDFARNDNTINSQFTILNWVESVIEVGCRHIHPTRLSPATMRLHEVQVSMLGMFAKFSKIHEIAGTNKKCWWKICRKEKNFLLLHSLP